MVLELWVGNMDGGGGEVRSSGSYAGEANLCKRSKTVLPVRKQFQKPSIKPNIKPNFGAKFLKA